MFNARVDVYARRITTDEKLRERLLDGRAYGAAAEFAGSWGAGLDVVQREQVREVYRLALRTVWFVGLAFALVGVVVGLGMGRVVLQGGLEENGYGLKEKGDEKVVDGREGSNRVEEVFHAVETGKREETGGRA